MHNRLKRWSRLKFFTVNFTSSRSIDLWQVIISSGNVSPRVGSQLITALPTLKFAHSETNCWWWWLGGTTFAWLLRINKNICKKQGYYLPPKEPTKGLQWSMCFCRKSTNRLALLLFSSPCPLIFCCSLPPRSSIQNIKLFVFLNEKFA